MYKTTLGWAFSFHWDTRYAYTISVQKSLEKPVSKIEDNIKTYIMKIVVSGCKVNGSGLGYRLMRNNVNTLLEIRMLCLTVIRSIYPLI